MKTNIQLFTIFFIAALFPVFSIAQEVKRTKKISISDIYIQLGSVSEKSQNATLANFKTLAPNSEILKTDFKDYQQGNSSCLAGNTIFSMLLGIQFSENQKASRKNGSPLLRLGFSYYSGSSLSTNYYKMERNVFDTLVSAQTGEMYFIDSVTHKSTGMNYSLQQLRFDASLIFRTNPQARWSFYTGLGMTAGISLNSSTKIYYNEYSWEDMPNINEGNYSFQGAHYDPELQKTENHTNKSQSVISAYVPLGIDFRLGRRGAFWKSAHLFYELRPGISFASVPELKTFTNTNIQHGPGIRVNWN